MSRRLPMPVPGFGEVLSGRLGKRHAAGPDADDALAVAAQLRSAGRLVTCDYVAHSARTAAEADAMVQRLVDLLDRLRATGLARDESPGAATATVDLLIPGGVLGSGAAAETRLRRLCEAAAAAGSCVSLRPESVTDIDACLDVVSRVRGEFGDTGIELWASLRRTAGDLTGLLQSLAQDGGGAAAPGRAGPRVMLRTTRDGARVPVPAGLPTATDIDRAFIRYTKRLLGGATRPVLAAPDATLVEIVLTLAARAAADAARGPGGRPEIMIDMGRRGDEVTRLSAMGHAVRVKVPFGPRWRAVGLRQFGARPPLTGLSRAAIRRGVGAR